MDSLLEKIETVETVINRSLKKGEDSDNGVEVSVVFDDAYPTNCEPDALSLTSIGPLSLALEVQVSYRKY